MTPFKFKRTPATEKPLPSLRQVLSRVHFRVTLFAVGLAGLTVLLTGFTALGVYAQQNLALIAQTASYSVAPAIVFDNAEAARAGIEPLAKAAGVAEITVASSDGKVVATITNSAPPTRLSLQWAAERLFLPRPASAAVTHNGALIGEVRVRGDAAIIAGYIRLGIAGGLACLILTALASRLLARHLQQSVIRPLAEIAGLAHSVRVDRTFERRAPRATIREIDTLGSDFNALLGELEEWQRHLRSENAALSHLATHDTLTGLPNRANFDRQLASMLEQARRTGTSFAVLYADGDDFKAINDRHGHAAGDAVLAEVGARLRAGLRTQDVAARLGGDEFAILLAAPNGPEAVNRVRDWICTQMAAPIVLPSGEEVTLSLTVGAAVYPRDGGDVAALIHHADIDMLAAKPASYSSRRFGKK